MSLDMSAAKGLDEPKLEALIEIMYLAASADGEFSDVELEHFKKSVESLSDGRIVGDRLTKLIDDAKGVAGDDWTARLTTVKDRLHDPAARKVALGLAIQVTAADGIIRTSERELIMEAADTLEIDRDEAADLVKQLSP